MTHRASILVDVNGGMPNRETGVSTGTDLTLIGKSHGLMIWTAKNSSRSYCRPVQITDVQKFDPLAVLNDERTEVVLPLNA